MVDLWQKMKDEFKSLGGPGMLWLHEIEKIAQQIVNKKKLEGLPPSVFGFTDWDKDDLAQMVLTDRLLGRGQAQYVVDTADTIEEARIILRNELNIVLADRRVPNQVDNVWKNLEPKLAALGWVSGSELYEEQEEFHNQVVRLILNQKRLRNRGSVRYSPLFASGVLDNLAEELYALNSSLSSKLLIRALRSALTIISPALSIEDVDNIEESSEILNHSYEAGEENLRSERARYGSRTRELAHEICEKLQPETLEIVFQKGNGANQSEIAAVLGVTRQTCKNRIEAAEREMFVIFEKMQLEMTESAEVLSAVLDILGVRWSGGLHA